MVYNRNCTFPAILTLFIHFKFIFFAAGVVQVRFGIGCNLQSQPNFCSEQGEGFHPNPTDCTKFIRCVQTVFFCPNPEKGSFMEFHFNCAPGTHFDRKLLICNFPSRSGCSIKTGEGDINPNIPTRRPLGEITTTKNHNWKVVDPNEIVKDFDTVPFQPEEGLTDPNDFNQYQLKPSIDSGSAPAMELTDENGFN